MGPPFYTKTGGNDMKVQVIKSFYDKNTGDPYNADGIYESSDKARIAELRELGYLAPSQAVVNDDNAAKEAAEKAAKEAADKAAKEAAEKAAKEAADKAAQK